jgi:ACT domain-containing protein
MNKSHYSIAHEIICVCAVDNKESFNNLNNWIVNVRELLNNDNVPVFLMANKCDVIAQERVVPKNKLKELAESYGIEYIECSAKENINILDVSQTIVDGIFTMTMMVDIDRMDKSLDVFGDHITSMGKERDLIIRVMHEDIFNSMHQI